MSATATRKCGHSVWQQCECDKPIKGARERVRLAINALADEFSKWAHGLPHDSTCIVYETGMCYCSVHMAMRAVDEQYREMTAAIDAVYEDAVVSERR
jgi:hypothetical protein